MKRLIVFIMSLVFALVPASAMAEHSGDWMDLKWNNTGSTNYCIEDFDGPLSDAEFDNMQATVNNTIELEFEQDTQFNHNFVLLSGQCANNYEFGSHTCGSAESNNMASRISYDDVDTSRYAQTMQCDFTGDNKLDFFWISICPETSNSCQSGTEGNNGYHWNRNGQGGFDDLDFPSLFTHEFSHAIGWDGHFSNSSGACPALQNGSFPPTDQQTMCGADDNYWQHHDGGSQHNCCVWRGLGANHDVPEINEQY